MSVTSVTFLGVWERNWGNKCFFVTFLVISTRKTRLKFLRHIKSKNIFLVFDTHRLKEMKDATTDCLRKLCEENDKKV